MRVHRTPPHLDAATRAQIEKSAGSWESVSVAGNDGVLVRAWYLTPRSLERGCVIALHGIGDSRASSAQFAKFLLPAGYAVLAADLRGHGESGGDLVTYGLKESGDVAAWARWLRSRGCLAVFGVGESLGGAVLIQAAEAAGLRAVVAECAFQDMASIAVDRVGSAVIVKAAFWWAWLRYGVDIESASPMRSAARTRIPILLIHGLQDDRTRPSHSEAIARVALNARLWLVPNAGHTGAWAAAPQEFPVRVLEWLAF